MATNGAVGEPLLVVIVGPTASGKTSLAIELAKQNLGEIICADSRTVYKGMHIGTAKPTKDEQAEVPHWGIDLVEPNEKFSAADFKHYAVAKIAEIRSRGKVPFLVGGTGLYIDSVIFDYQFGASPDASRRKYFEGMSVDELQSYCVDNNINLPTNERNKRHLVRTAERKSINNKRRIDPIENTIVVALATQSNILKARIAQRAEQLFETDVVGEATVLGKKYGWNHESMTSNIYPIAHAYLKNELSLSGAVDKFTTSDWQLAKRQMTWFRRNPYIEWATTTEAKTYIQTLLARE